VVCRGTEFCLVVDSTRVVLETRNSVNLGRDDTLCDGGLHSVLVICCDLGLASALNASVAARVVIAGTHYVGVRVAILTHSKVARQVREDSGRITTTAAAGSAVEGLLLRKGEELA